MNAEDIELGECSGCGGVFETSDLIVDVEFNHAYCEACQYEYEAKMDAVSDE